MGKEKFNIKFYIAPLTLFFILMVFLTLFGDHGILELKKLTNKHNGIRSNISAIKSENEGLLVEIDKLKTSKQYIENLARKDFGMVKDGEIVFLFQD